jgi:hypothetical protein
LPSAEPGQRFRNPISSRQSQDPVA